MWWEPVKFGATQVQCGKYRISKPDSEGSRPQPGHAGVMESVSRDKSATGTRRGRRFRAAWLRSWRRPGTADAQGMGAIRFAERSPKSFRDAPPKSAMADLGTSKRRSRVNRDRWREPGIDNHRPGFRAPRYAPKSG